MSTKSMKNTLKYSLLACLSAGSLIMGSCMKDDPNPAKGTPVEEASLYVIRNLYKNTDISLTKSMTSGAGITAGVVVSNAASKNLPDGIIALENVWRGQTRGLYIQVADAHKYQFGDSLRIAFEGSRLTLQDGNLVLTGLDESKINVAAQGIQKNHRAISIGNLKANYTQYEATLIKVTADVEPEPAIGTTFAGEKILMDGEQNKLILSTAASSPFAGGSIAPSASFQGLSFRKGEQLELRMQTAQDMVNPSGKLYRGWPETFEEPYQVKTSYNMTATNNLVDLTTGNWYLLQSIQGNTAGRDRIVSGTQAIRFQQNLSSPAYLQMNFDMAKGASKVSFWYGAYYTDRSSTFVLESSIDQGATWIQVGEPITDAPTTTQSSMAKEATFVMNITVPVRFRIKKLGLGTSTDKISNGRLGIDDFAIYQSY